MPTQELAQYVVQLGISTALVLYFVWRDYQREGHTRREKSQMVARMEKVEDGFRTEVLEITRRCVTAIDQVTTAVQRCTEVTERLDRWLERNTKNGI